MPLTRRKVLLAGAATLAAGLGYPLFAEPRWLDRIVTKIPLRPRGTPVRLLQLSDLHYSWSVSIGMIEAAIELGLEAQPDIICLTGDFITDRSHFDAPLYSKTLRRLSSVRPTFAIFGNHDGGVWARVRRGFDDHSVVNRILEDAQIMVLHNRSQTVEVREGKIALVGLGDLWANEMRPDAAFQAAARDLPTVLLSHNPDTKDMLGHYRWDLMLCGHTHGGQVILPFHGTRFAPVEDLRYVAGLNGWRDRQIYTSRGVGNVGHVRFRCRPEVTVLDLLV